MSSKAQKILVRYEKGYVTDVQLERYLSLGAITQDEYDEIYVTKHPKEDVVEDTSEEEAVEEVTE